MRRKLLAEGLGTAFLLAAVVGSGIMGERLSQGNTAITLLANSIATGAALFVLISLFAPISGAHFNPAVTLVEWMRGRMTLGDGTLYIVVQVVGACVGVAAAHAMFDLSIFSMSVHARTGIPQWWSEFVAAFGLLLTILLGGQFAPQRISALVACYITAAYWFTASTSFANPAVTLARSLTDTFAGIQPGHVLPFVAAQMIGAAAAMGAAAFLLEQSARVRPTSSMERQLSSVTTGEPPRTTTFSPLLRRFRRRGS